MSAPPMTTMASGFCVSRADAVRERRRQEAEHRHERRHQHRAQPPLGGVARALLEVGALVPQPLRVGDDEDRVLDGDAEDRDEAHRRRDREVACA